jgi:hypothetical protein
MKKLFMEMMRYIKMGLFLFWYGNTMAKSRMIRRRSMLLSRPHPKASDAEGTGSNQQETSCTSGTRMRGPDASFGLIGGGCVGVGIGSFGVDVYGRPGPMI